MQREGWKSYTGKGERRGTGESLEQHPSPWYPGEVLRREHKPRAFASIPTHSLPRGGRAPWGSTSQNQQGRARAAPRGSIPPEPPGRSTPQPSLGQPAPQIHLPRDRLGCGSPQVKAAGSEGLRPPNGDTPRDGDATSPGGDPRCPPRWGRARHHPSPTEDLSPPPEEPSPDTH